MDISRKRAAELAQETLEIIQKGYYLSANGENVSIEESLENAVKKTCSYPPEYKLPLIQTSDQKTTIEIKNETTLVAAQRLAEEHYNIVALNFASAKNPGGGFLGGSKAQEESLARSSGLYACLRDQKMYDFHRRLKDPFYTNYAIYSPAVPVFRDDIGELLNTPFRCAFITSPAVNAGVVLKRKSASRKKVQEEMWKRILKVLTLAAIQKHDALILGAWGCGVFGNDPQEIAELFKKALAEEFSGVFRKIIFAITDWSHNQRFIGPFSQVFQIPIS